MLGILANAKTSELPTLLGCIADRLVVVGSSQDFYGPLHKNVHWIREPSNEKIAGWATGILSLKTAVPERLLLASDTFDVLFPEVFLEVLSQKRGPGMFTFAGPQQFLGDLVWLEGKDVVSRVLAFFRERSLEDYVGHPPASLFVDFDVGLPMTLKNVGIPWTILHPTRVLRSLASPLESPTDSQDPMTDCWDRLLMDGCPILSRQRRSYPGDASFIDRFLSCPRETKAIVLYVPRDVIRPAPVFGFLILGPDKDARCLSGIREYYPQSPVMTREARPGTLPYSGDGYLALLEKPVFQKAIVIPDNVIVTGRFDEAIESVKTSAFLWHSEKKAQNKKASQKHALGCLKPDVRLSVQRLHDRGPWMGCVSCGTISEVDYLKALDSKYGLFSEGPACYEHVLAVVMQHHEKRVMYGLFGNVQNKTQYPMMMR